MQATTGSATSFRSRGRLIGCCMALVLALSALVFAPAANAQSSTTGPFYLSLGDSISFGYTQQKFNENYPTESPSAFEEGFPNFFNKDLKKESKEITLDNLACPGETSNGLIGESKSLGGQKSTEEPSPPALYQGPGDWHPCAYHNIDHYPLHLEYGSLSQLEEAVSILTSENPSTGKLNEVKAITLNIGSNDELALVTQCKIEVTEEFTKTGKSKYGSSPEAAILKCVESKDGVEIPRVLNNIADILTVLDKHYSGPIVLLGFYNPDSFVFPGSDLAQVEINRDVENKVVPDFPNVAYANPFPVFNKGKNATQEQASICKWTEMCNPNVQEGEGTNPKSPLYNKEGDPHPTVKGSKKLAQLVKTAYSDLLKKGI